ncbi:MAG: hypothetical protein AABZ53_11965 [Planctomycetota bacterium]
MHAGTIRSVAIALVLLLGAGAWGQEMFRLPGATWQLMVPKGWEIAKAEELAEITRGANELIEKVPGGPKIVYDLMLVASDGTPGTVLVQHKPALPEGLDFDSASKAIIKSMGSMQSKISDAGAMGFASDSIVGDPASKCVVMRATLDVNSETPVGTIMVLHFGKSDTVSVLVSVPGAELSAREADMRTIANGVVFDSGAQYTFSSQKARTKTERLGEMIAFGLGFMILIVLLLRRKQLATKRAQLGQ